MHGMLAKEIVKMSFQNGDHSCLFQKENAVTENYQSRPFINRLNLRTIFTFSQSCSQNDHLIICLTLYLNQNIIKKRKYIAKTTMIHIYIYIDQNNMEYIPTQIKQSVSILNS